MPHHSPDVDEDEDSDELAAAQPSKKKKNIQDFFGKASSSAASGSAGSSKSSSEANTKTKPQPRKVSKSMKPASPPKAKKAPPTVIKSDSEDEIDMYDDLPKPPPRAPAKRTARSKAKTYIDIGSEEDEGDGSLFVDDD